MITTTEEQLYGFCQFPSSKIHWEEFFYLEKKKGKVFKKNKILLNFLCQKFITKYGIGSNIIL